MEKQAEPRVKKWQILLGIVLSSLLLLALLFAILSRLNDKVSFISRRNQDIERFTNVSHISALLQKIRPLTSFTSSRAQEKSALEAQFKESLSTRLADNPTLLSSVGVRGQPLSTFIEKTLSRKIGPERNPVLFRQYGILIQALTPLSSSISTASGGSLNPETEIGSLANLDDLISESIEAFGKILGDGIGLSDKDHQADLDPVYFQSDLEEAELLLFRVADQFDALRTIFPEIDTPLFKHFIAQGNKFVEDSQGLLDRRPSFDPFAYMDSGFRMLDRAVLIQVSLSREIKKRHKGEIEQLDLLTTSASFFTMMAILLNAYVLIRLYRKNQVAYAKLLQTNRYAHLILNHMLDAVITTDNKGRIEKMNSAAERIFGYAIGELRGKPIRCLSGHRGEANTESDLARYFTDKASSLSEIIPEVLCQRCDGSIFHGHLVMVSDNRSDTSTFTGILQDLSQHKLTQETLKKTENKLEKANQGLKHLLLFDGLTQIPDRKHFERRLEEELNRARRENADLALIVCDIDYLNQFIKSSGRIAGDDGLKRVAEVIKGSLLRSVDLLARYGGETFAVILPSTDAEGAKTLAEQIKKSLWQENIPHPASFIANRVTLSIGITSNQFGDDYRIEPLIERADQALFLAKSKGKNRIELKA